MALPEDLNGLKKMGIADLRQLHAALTGKQVASGNADQLDDYFRGPGVVLQREIAWHVQQQAMGGMDAQTRSLLKAAMKQAAAAAKAKVARKQARAVHKPARGRAFHSSQLKTGSRLVRHWGGVPHEVTVLEDGKRFEYRGEVYRSLTQIAKVITGAHWSGPRFFSPSRG